LATYSDRMRRLYLIFFSLLSCHHPVSIKAQRLADALATLKKKADFRPLNQDDAYAFMNRYYLPRLDSLQTRRKIFIHPLNGVDFNELFNEDSTKLEKEYASDSKRTILTAVTPPPPPSVNLNKKFSWDSKKLLKTIVIKDYVANSGNGISYDNIDSIKAWHRKYGYGYMCVSYPQYNAYTKSMVIREWVENDDWCGTGRESKFWFTRTATGWKIETFEWNNSQYKTKNP
jgi:hypothetical protein